MESASDPRLKSSNHYDRDEIIALLDEFYQFLGSLPHIKPFQVLQPPVGGWDNITTHSCAGLKKNDEVISLLKHLPYIDMDNHQHLVAWDTYACDYRGRAFQRWTTQDPNTVTGWGFPYVPGADFPPWVIPLTFGIENVSTFLILDTTDGE